METSNLVGRLSVAIASPCMVLGVPERGVVKSREPFKFLNFFHIPATADRLRRCQLSSPVSVVNF